MKTLTGFFACFICLSSLWGQGFIKAEYFFDVDPGTNNGTSIVLGSSNDTVNFSADISTATLSPGFHFLGLRILHQDNIWSVLEPRRFYMLPQPTSDVQDIVAAEYYIDADPGPGNAIAIPVGPSGDMVAFTATIPTSLTPGFHFLAIRTQDAEGKWGILEPRRFYVLPPNAPNMPIITAAEYYIDSDPGPGNATAIPIGPSGDIVAFAATIPTSLAPGFHFLAIRTQDAEGIWGILETRRFYVLPPDAPTMPVITAAEYFFDLDPGPGNGHPLQVPLPGDIIEFSSDLTAHCLVPGQHFMSIRVRDLSNHWSLFSYDTLTITAGIVALPITPVGPEIICQGDSVTLSAEDVPGIIYQWLLEGNDISGANSPTYPVHTAGNYSLKVTCHDSMAISNVVTVIVLVPTIYYADSDNDTYGNAAEDSLSCLPPVGYVTDNTDCDDNNSAIHEPVSYFIDADHDGYGSSDTEMVCALTPPLGYSTNSLDCDDTNPLVNPDATEVCNGIDDDCDGLIDDDDPGITGQPTWYFDFDGDGFGTQASTLTVCEQPVGFVANDDDCDDTDPEVNPNAPEVCNGIDDDCDGLVDDDDPDVTGQSVWYADSDGDGFGDPNVSVLSCNQPPGFVANDDDCDDTDPEVNPNAPEVCNGIDDDCDGLVDDDDPDVTGQSTWYADTDGDGFGDPASSLESCDQPLSYISNDEDCDDTSEDINPEAQEVCNDIDDDCDGLIDDDDPDVTGQSTWYADTDGDGFGDPASSLDACDQPLAYVSNDEDCDDTNGDVNPNAQEVCNGIDDDCDGLIDDADPDVTGQSTWYADTDGDGFGDPASLLDACDQPLAYVSNDEDCDDTDGEVNPDAQEVCNGIDDDCDGLVDDDDPDVTGQSIFYADLDGDSYGAGTSILACIQLPNTSTNNTDCNDENAAIHPGATEIINGLDDNCNGQIDEGATSQISDLWVTNGVVNDIAIADSTMYIGGDFTEVYCPAINSVRVSPSTGLPLPGWRSLVTNGTVRAAVSDNAGGYYIGGSFTMVGDSVRNRLCHIDANGSVTSWNPNAGGTVHDIVVVGNTVYVGGSFHTIGGQLRRRIAAISSVTGTATSWNPNANDNVYAIVVSGNIVYIGGNFKKVGGLTRNRLAAIDINTGLPTTLIAHASHLIYTIAISDSILYVGGNFTSIGGQTRRRIAAIDISTGGVTSWNPNANSAVRTLAISGSTLYAGGNFSTIGGQTRPYIAALSTDTGLATTWNPNANSHVEKIVVSGNIVYALGTFSIIGGQTRFRAAALNKSNGSATTWNPNLSHSSGGHGGSYGFAIAFSGNDVYVGGVFSSIGLQTRNRIAALNTNTGAVTLWNPNADKVVYTLDVSGSLVYAGGIFTQIGGQTRNRIAAMNRSGTGTATIWNPNVNGSVLGIEVDGDIVYACGSFTSVGNQTRNRLVAINKTGTGTLTTWNPSANNAVYAIAVAESLVYAGGSFTNIGGQSRSRIAALNKSGTGSASSWNPGANSIVHTLLLSGTTLYAGGQFTNIGSQSRNRIASLSINNNLASDWNPNANGIVRTLAISDGHIYAGGDFTTLGGEPRDRLAAIEAITGSVTSWDPSANASTNVLKISGSTVYAGGAFTTIGGKSVNYLAAIPALPPANDLLGLQLRSPVLKEKKRTEVKEISMALECFPNPASESVYVSFLHDQESPFEIRLVDLNGRVVRNFSAHTIHGQNQIELDLSGTESGIYILVLDLDQKRAVKKIIIE